MMQNRSSVYDPTYDPLLAPNPGQGQAYAPTYWAATAGALPADDGAVIQGMDADVVIIGAGFTGLACAAVLAREYGIKATILEANRTAWGCTSRNGGQAQNASGRLKRSEWIKRWGKDIALGMHAECSDGFAFLQHMIESGEIQCDPQAGGHLYIAHRESKLAYLQAEAEVHNRVFGYKSRMIDADTLRREYVNDAESFGAMLEPDGIGLHPLKLAYGYLRMARHAGAKLYTASPVLRWEQDGGYHYLQTPGGAVRTKVVAVATGGYTSQNLTPWLRNKIMPILSNSIVTRPLTASEIATCGFKTHQIITDTRILRHYYRLLPDNRLQMGSRSAITGKQAPQQQYLTVLKGHMQQKFPALHGIKIDYSWWGWVDVSHDMMPRIFQPDAAQQVFYALGYGGNGVMYSAQAGRRMADWIAGKAPPELPIFQSPLPSHLFAPFRRLGQRMLYQWYHLKDEVF